MRGTLHSLTLALAALLASCAGPGTSDPASERERMVEATVVDAGIRDPRVIAAMRATPRHRFVPPSERARAHHDMALPIGEGQTISSPFIVAAMTEALALSPEDRVLEVGTGSGYQAAVLSPLVAEVYSVEIVPELAARATATLAELGYDNIFVRQGDGFLGWPEQAPFDRIIVTCSPEDVPAPLVEQLAPDGLIVIPVGDRYQQTLYRMRVRDGELLRESLRPTLFVPMTGRAGREGRDTASHVVNAGFELPRDERGFLPGWFDQRGAERVASERAPEGAHYLRFDNRTPGSPAHVMQGLAADGRKLAALELLAWVKLDGVTPFPGGDPPQVALHVFDADHALVALESLGPLAGSASWQLLRKRVTLPASARQAVLRLGLFGGSGRAGFDAVRISPVPR